MGVIAPIIPFNWNTCPDSSADAGSFFEKWSVRLQKMVKSKSWQSRIYLLIYLTLVEILVRVPKLWWRRSRRKNFWWGRSAPWGAPGISAPGQRSKKWQRQKILAKNIFWSESIQNGPKRISKRKSRFRKFFLIMTWHSQFFEKWGPRSKKLLRTKFFGRKKFFGRNWFRLVQIVF